MEGLTQKEYEEMIVILNQYDLRTFTSTSDEVRLQCLRRQLEVDSKYRKMTEEQTAHLQKTLLHDLHQLRQLL